MVCPIRHLRRNVDGRSPCRPLQYVDAVRLEAERASPGQHRFRRLVRFGDAQSIRRLLWSSIRTCAANDSFAFLPRPFLISLGSGSVFDACVSLLRFLPWKSARPLKSLSSSSLSRGRKLFINAQTSISVLSTEKWSEFVRLAPRATWTTSTKNCRAISCRMSHSRLSENAQWSKVVSVRSMSKNH